jgi:hypothetical protein
MSRPLRVQSGDTVISTQRTRDKKDRVHEIAARVYEGKAPSNYSYYAFDPLSRHANLLTRSSLARIASLCGFTSVSPQGYSILAGLMDLGIQNAMEQVHIIGDYARQKGYTGTKFGHPHHVQGYHEKFPGEIAMGRLPPAAIRVMEENKQNANKTYEARKGGINWKKNEMKKHLYAALPGCTKWLIRTMNTTFPSSSKLKLKAFGNQISTWLLSGPNQLLVKQVCWPCTEILARDVMQRFAWKIEGNRYLFENKGLGITAIKSIVTTAKAEWDAFKVISRKTAPLFFSVKPWEILMINIDVGNNDAWDENFSWYFRMIGKAVNSLFDTEQFKDSAFGKKKIKYIETINGAQSSENDRDIITTPTNDRLNAVNEAYQRLKALTRANGPYGPSLKPQN